MTNSAGLLREGFEYLFSPVDPVAGAHIDPPSGAICETLMTKAPDGTALPCLAEAWEVSADGLEWRFRLRPGLRFHSGAPCDAAAVVAALERCRWGDARTRQLQYFDPVDRIDSRGAHLVVIRALHPTTRILPMLWGTHCTIFNEAARSRIGPGLYGRVMADATGPYRLADWTDTRVIAEPADTWTGQTAHGLARIEWLAIREEGARLAALIDGKVDCLNALPASAVATLADDRRLRCEVTPQSSNVYLALNWRRRDLGFDRTEVRRALSLAIDRAGMVRDVLHGQGCATWGPVPPGAEFHDPAAGAEGRHDPDRAERLLDAAGWPRGEDGIRRRDGRALAFDCAVQDDSVLFASAERLCADLARIGVVVRLAPVTPFAPFYARLGEGPDAFVSKWLWPDPIDALAGFCSTASQPRSNWQHASVPALDRAFSRFREPPDRAATTAAAREVQRLIAEELPLVPLFTPHEIRAAHHRIAGLKAGPQDLYSSYLDVRIGDLN